jgi:hypothetical protein
MTGLFPDLRAGDACRWSTLRDGAEAGSNAPEAERIGKTERKCLPIHRG